MVENLDFAALSALLRTVFAQKDAGLTRAMGSAPATGARADAQQREQRDTREQQTDLVHVAGRELLPP